MATNASRVMESTNTKLPKASTAYLAIAALVDFGLAFFPVWSLTTESGSLNHVVQLFRTVVQETVTQPRELIAVFWLPFAAGVVCLGAALAAFFVSNGPLGARAVIFTPIAVTIVALVYFLAMRADVHILVISLLPLGAALWEYHKSRRAP